MVQRDLRRGSRVLGLERCAELEVIFVLSVERVNDGGR